MEIIVSENKISINGKVFEAANLIFIKEERGRFYFENICDKTVTEAKRFGDFLSKEWNEFNAYCYYLENSGSFTLTLIAKKINFKDCSITTSFEFREVNGKWQNYLSLVFTFNKNQICQTETCYANLPIH
jgi:hypothetical protein